MKCTTVGKDERDAFTRVSRRVINWKPGKVSGSRDAPTAGNVEQCIRGSKIDSRYESTTAVQAQDFFRKIACDRGGALAHVAGEIPKFVDSDSADGRRKPERALLPSRWRTQG